MKVIVVGAGEVGFHIADRLSKEGHDVTVIERASEREKDLKAKLDAQVVVGSGASTDALEEAGARSAELFIAVADQDEVNLIACLIAAEFGVKRVIARIRGIEYASRDWSRSKRTLGLDLIINPESVVADEICNTVIYSSASEVVEFAGGRVIFLGFQVREESALADVSMKTLGAIRGIYRMVATAITRGDETIIPRGDDTIRVGDILYFVCKAKELPAISDLFGFEAMKTKTVFILGGGRIGYEVAKQLASMKYRVKLIDRNPEHCLEMAEKLDNVLVLNAKGTDVENLKNEGIAEGDVFVAVTQDDQSNILCSLLAKKHGVKRAIALVNQREYVSLAPSLGVDVCISPRQATASAILKYVRRGEVVNMAILEQSEAEVLEILLPGDCPILNQPLKSLSIPRGAIIGALIRNDDVIVPSGDDHLEADDHVVVFALPDAVTDIEEFFASR